MKNNIATIMINHNEQIQKAADIIRNGGAVAFPTETVYGLGANGLNEKAAARIFEIKKRPFFDPLILHIGGKEWTGELAIDVPAPAQKLIDRFWPGPLTVVLPKKSAVPDIITSGLPGVAIRMPSNDIALQLIALAGVPVAAPSANLFGAVSPTTAEHVREQLGANVEMIIDGGMCTVGVESTIVSFMTDAPMLLRPGGITIEEIEEAIGEIIIPKHDEFVNQSPGRNDSHYATKTPLFLVDDVDSIDKNVNAGLLTAALINPKTLSPNITKIECLSTTGDLREAACNLFAAMRRLDASGVDMIAALPVPDTGLGAAINDRLYRASRKR
ncbi:MAG: threonylcarbamoyl-AMP synthase [Chitinispirillales bacterium]|nr:threonylcarbamoyl-AMP synthase [Chitinispirillales bacterium]